MFGSRADTAWGLEEAAQTEHDEEVPRERGDVGDVEPARETNPHSNRYLLFGPSLGDTKKPIRMLSLRMESGDERKNRTRPSWREERSVKKRLPQY